MCAICGIFDLAGKPVDRGTLAAMRRVVRHRGPDGAGQFVDNEVGIAHRRLSIIDIGGGTQPMANEDGTIQVVFNGEIYNFVELRRELADLGHQFKTCSDTEVIVHAYEQWGAASVKRFNGMFAFAIWDARRRELFLARDHLGVKPLYYITLGTRLLFASEIKSLLQDSECPRAVDIEALAEIFTFRYVPSPKTLFHQIFKLPPAHCLTASRAGIRMERFWEWVPCQPLAKCKEADLVEEYQSLLEDAVRLQMRSDVPVGLFLSSGIDSGVLLALMAKYATGPVQTFTIGFEDGEKTNEVKDAANLARMFGADHYAQMLSPGDYADYYERYMWDLEEPVGNETAAAFYFVSKMASQKVKVALTGQGADEPWAGYDRYKGVKISTFYNRMPRIVADGLARMIGALPGRMERLKRGAVSLSEPDILTRFTKIYSFFSAEMKAALYRDKLKSLSEDPYGARLALSRLQGDVAHLDPLTQMLYIDARAGLPDDLLMVADKTSMANSIETRVPFLDFRLVEFIESLPPNLKLKGFTGKFLHKKALEKWLPKTMVHRPKKGFSNPIENWFRVGMKSFVDECLLSRDAWISDYFDQSYMEKMIAMDRAGKQQYRRHIYLLVSLELWHREFMG